MKNQASYNINKHSIDKISEDNTWQSYLAILLLSAIWMYYLTQKVRVLFLLEQLVCVKQSSETIEFEISHRFSFWVLDCFYLQWSYFSGKQILVCDGPVVHHTGQATGCRTYNTLAYLLILVVKIGGLDQESLTNIHQRDNMSFQNFDSSS